MRELVTKLKQKYTLTDVVHQRDALTYLTCEKKWAVELVTELKLQEGFTHLTLLTAVDWLEEGNFQLTYLLNNPDTMQTMGVRVLLPRDEASMHSIHHLWATAATYQRELYEMFGIDFPGSPRLDEPFILEGWKDLPPTGWTLTPRPTPSAPTSQGRDATPTLQSST